MAEMSFNICLFDRGKLESLNIKNINTISNNATTTNNLTTPIGTDTIYHLLYYTTLLTAPTSSPPLLPSSYCNRRSTPSNSPPLLLYFSLFVLFFSHNECSMRYLSSCFFLCLLGIFFFSRKQLTSQTAARDPILSANLLEIADKSLFSHTFMSKKIGWNLFDH